EAARTGDVRPAPDHVAGDMVLDRPAVDADGVHKARAGNDVIGGQLVLSHNPPRFAYAELRRDVDDIGVGESGRLALEKLEEGERLLAALDLAGAQFAGVGAVDRAAIRALHLRDIDAPFVGVFLRPHDRALARKLHAAFFGLFHQRRDGAPGLAGALGIDTAHAKHHGRVKRIAGLVAFLESGAGKGGKIAVARAVDEHAGRDRAASRLAFDQQRLEA